MRFKSLNNKLNNKQKLNMRTLKSKVLLFTFAIAAFSMIVAGCSKKDDGPRPYTIQLEQDQYGLPIEGQVRVNIIADRIATKDIIVNYEVTGTISEDNYEVNQKSFVIKAGQKSGEVVFTIDPSKIQDTQKLKIQLKATEVEFNLGSLNSAEILILPANSIIYSFDKENYIMTENVEVTVKLMTVTGNYITQSEIRIPLVLGANSTAIEGEHFEFVKGIREIVIPAGKSEGKIELKLLEQEVDKDRISLEMAGEHPLLKPGNYEFANVFVFGSQYKKLVGTWEFKAFTNQAWWIGNNSWGGDDLDLLPTANAKDKITFDEEGISVAMTGDLKNYFRKSPLSYVKEESEALQEIPGFPITRVNIAVVNALANVAFSATTSTERLAEMGFRVFEEDGKEFLEVTIRDYEPVNFLQLTLGMYKSWEVVPYFKSMPLRYHFVKVEATK